jgi:hypothetical protein
MEYRTVLHAALNLFSSIPDSKLQLFYPSQVFARRVIARCTTECNTISYAGPTIILTSGVWVSDVDSANLLLTSIGDVYTQIKDARGQGTFQVTVTVPGLSVYDVIAPPTGYDYTPYPNSSSSPNLGLIIPLSVMGGITLLLVCTMAICRRCKMRQQERGYSVVETEAASNYPGESVQMETYSPSNAMSPSPMLATAPTATVVPGNYAMPTYMVSNGTAMPQYYMVSNAGAPMSPIYTQPVQGGYILTYMPTQTNQ